MRSKRVRDRAKSHERMQNAGNPALNRIRWMALGVRGRARGAVPASLLCFVCVLSFADRGLAAGPLSIEDFASRPRIEGVSISPDGRYLALIESRDGKGIVLIVDRTPGAPVEARPVLREPDHFYFSWCRWATDTRLLCGLRGMVREQFVYGISRLVGVDADGKHMKVLVQSNHDAQGQFQDRIINWNPGPPNAVLIEADEGMGENEFATGAQVYGNVGTHGLPAVFELDVAADEAVSPGWLSHCIEEFDIKISGFLHFMGVGDEVRPFLGGTGAREKPEKETENKGWFHRWIGAFPSCNPFATG